MNTPRERTVSGRSLVIGALVVTAAVTAAALVFGPGLRDKVLQEQRPRTLREPIATGTYDGEVWEAVGRFDGTANCVELRYVGKVLDRACDSGPHQVVTQLPSDGPTIVYGVAPEDRETMAVPLEGADDLSLPVQAGELGFPVGFWAGEVPAGAALAGDTG
jgi:hypothetical protein